MSICKTSYRRKSMKNKGRMVQVVRYDYDFQRQGKIYRSMDKGEGAKHGYPTRNAADKAEAARKRELKQKSQTQTTDMGYVDIAEKWLDHIKARRTPKYYTECKRAVERTLEEWEDKTPTKITISDAEEHLNELAEESSNWVANYDLRLLKALFNYASHKKRKWVHENPFDDIEPFPLERKIKYVPPKADVNKVLLKANRIDRLYLETVVDTVGRISEINRLTLATDVVLNDEDNSYVILKTKKKRHSDYRSRKHHMNKRMYNNFKYLFDNRQKGQVFVFENPKSYEHERYVNVAGEDHKPYTYRSKMLKKLCEDAKVKPFGYHELRHYGATLLADKNVPIPIIKEVLGHEDIRTTQIYIQNIEKSVKQAVQLLCEDEVVEMVDEEASRL